MWRKKELSAVNAAMVFGNTMLQKHQKNIEKQSFQSSVQNGKQNSTIL